MSQTMGYRTVLNPIENATNANPNIVAADLGIFPLRSISTRVYVKTIHHHRAAASKMTLSNREAA